MDLGWTQIESLSGKILPAVFAFVFAIFVAANCCSADGLARNNPQIEYIAPDGQFSSLTAAHPGAHKPSAAFVDPETISGALREGETTFIIQLSKKSTADRFTFLNENTAACGELRIAVSDSPLSANSPKWTEVDGIVPFAHKRLFKLSMLGVETKFVRLSFKVDGQNQDSARISDPFRTSFLAASIDQNFNFVRERGIDLTLAASVAALPTR